MMRILLDARYLDGTFSGIGTYSQEMIEHLALIDQKNEYIVLVHPDFDGRLELGDNFTVLTYPARPVSFSTLFALGRSVDALSVDIMHSFFPIAPLWMKTPLLVTVHDLQPFVDPEFSGRRIPLLQLGYKSFYHYIYPAILRKAKFIVNVSHHTRDTVAELFPDLLPKLMVIRSGLEKEMFERPDQPMEEVIQRYDLPKSYFLYYGSTRPNKNIPNVLRAFAHFLELYPDSEMKLVLILKKDRFFKDAARVIRQKNLDDAVRVLDQVPFSDKRSILANARTFIFATKYEGFGFPALEAMASGVPVIAGDSGALPEICGEAALFPDPDEPEEIAEAMAIFAYNDEERERYAKLGVKQASRFDWNEAAEQAADVYRLLF